MLPGYLLIRDGGRKLLVLHAVRSAHPRPRSGRLFCDLARTTRCLNTSCDWGYSNEYGNPAYANNSEVK
eukprot:scaffold63915_cov21-Prasinocladus_malaysianus.AAC.1